MSAPDLVRREAPPNAENNLYVNSFTDLLDLPLELKEFYNFMEIIYLSL
jgi:hypothetical protein